MKKTSILIIASAFVMTACTTVGADEKRAGQGRMMGQMRMDMSRMDSNADGMLSKDEFMSYHEAMFDRMKNKEGLVDMKDMQMHCSNMMNDNMMGGGRMMQEDMDQTNKQ